MIFFCDASCKMIITSRVVYGSTVFAVICAAVLLLRPGFAFDEAGRPRPFGLVDSESSVFSMGILSPVAALFSFLVADSWGEVLKSTRF